MAKKENKAPAPVKPVLPGGIAEEVTLNGSILGASAETFEQLFSKMFSALIVGDPNGDNVGALKSSVNEKTTAGVAGLINSQTAILNQINEQLKKTHETIDNLSKDLNETVINILKGGIGLPVVVIGGSLDGGEGNAEAEAAVKGELEILLSANSKEDFKELLKEISELNGGEILGDFELSIERISEAFKRVEESAESMKDAAIIVEGLASIGNIDSKTLDALLYFFEDLADMGKTVDKLPSTINKLNKSLAAIAENKDIIKDVLNVSDYMIDIFDNLSEVAFNIPDFDLNLVNSMAMAMHGGSKNFTRSSLMGTIDVLTGEEETYKTAILNTEHLIEIFTNLSEVAFLSKSLKKLSPEGLENVNQWFTSDESIFNAICGTDAKWSSKEFNEAHSGITKLNDIVNALKNMGDAADKIKPLTEGQISNIKEFLDKLTNFEDEEGVFTQIANVDSKKFETATKNMEAVTDLMGNVIMIGLLGVLFIPLAPIALLGILALTAVQSLMKKLVGDASDKEMANNTKAAMANMGELAKLVLVSTLCMLIGGFFVMKNPKLILGAIGFGLVLGLFILVVLGAVNLGARGMKDVGGLKTLGEITQFIIVCSLIMMIGGALVMFFPKLIIGALAFGLLLGIFLFCVLGTIALASKIMGKRMVKQINEITELIVICTLIMVLGGGLVLWFPQIIIGALAFGLILGIFLFTVLGSIMLAGKLMGKRMMRQIDDITRLIVLCTLILLIGGGLVLWFPQIIIGAIVFGLILSIFLVAVLGAVALGTKMMGKRGLRDAKQIMMLVIVCSVVLLIAGGVIAAFPMMMVTIPVFIICLVGLFLGMGLAAKILAKGGSNLKKGLVIMGFITALVFAASIAFGIIALIAANTPLGKMAITIGIMIVTIGLLTLLALGIGALATGPQAAAIAAGVAIMGVIIVLIGLIGVAVGIIGLSLMIWKNIGDLDFVNIMKNLATYVAMVACLTPLTLFAPLAPFIIGAVIASSTALTLIKFVFDLLANMKSVNSKTITSNIDTYMDMVWALAPLGLPIVTIIILRASVAAASMGMAIAAIAKGVADMASLTIPIYKGTEISGYRNLKDKDFQMAAKNVTLIVTTLGNALIDLYKQRPDMFSTSLFSSNTPFKIVCDSVGRLGNVISKIAKGVQDYAQMKVPIYEGTEVVGYRMLKDKDFQSAANNVKSVIMTLFNALLQVYYANPGLFTVGFWDSENTMTTVIKTTNKLGEVLSTIAKGVQEWANLKIPVKWNDKGEAVAYKALPQGFEIAAADNVKKIVTTLFTALIGVYNENRHMFKKGGMFGNGDTPLDLVIASSRELGKIMGDTAYGVQQWANLKVPVGWTAEGTPNKFISVDQNMVDFAIENVKSIITTLFDALADVYNSNPDMFKKAGLFGKGDSPVDKVIASSKELGSVVSGLGLGVKNFAVMTYVSEYDKEGRPSKVVKLDNSEIQGAIVNVGLVLTTLFDALSATYDKNPDLFEGKDSKINSVISSAKNMSGMLSGLGSGISAMATMMIPTEWNNEGKPIKFTQVTPNEMAKAGAAAGTIVKTISQSLLDLASDKKYAKYFDVDSDSNLSNIINSVKKVGGMIGDIGKGIQTFAELGIPKYNSDGQMIGKDPLPEDFFQKATENIQSIVKDIPEAIMEVYNLHPDWFDPEGIFDTVLEKVTVIGSTVGSIGQGIQEMAKLNLPTKWDKEGKPIAFKQMKPEDFEAAGTNVSTIIKTLGQAITDVYTAAPNLFDTSGESIFDKVVSSCTTMGEMIAGIADGLRQFTEIGLTEPEVKEISNSVSTIITTLGNAIAAVYERAPRLFELPPIVTVTKTKGFLGIGGSTKVDVKPNPGDTPFMKVIKGCSGMGSMIADIAMGVNEFANIYSKVLPDGSKLDLTKAAKNIGEIITAIGFAIAAVYNKNPNMFVPVTIGWGSNKQTSDSPIQAVASSIGTISGALVNIASIIAYFAESKFPMEWDENGKVTKVIHIDFKKQKKLVEQNIEDVCTTIINSMYNTSKKVKFPDTLFYDNLKEHVVLINDTYKEIAKPLDTISKLKGIKDPNATKGKIWGINEVSWYLVWKTYHTVKSMTLDTVSTLETGVENMILSVKAINKNYKELLKAIKLIPETPLDLPFANIDMIGATMNTLAAKLSLLLGTEKTVTKSVKGWLGFTRTESKVIFEKPDYLKLNLRGFKKMLEALNNINKIVRDISVHAALTIVLMEKMPDTSSVNPVKLETFFIKASEISTILLNAPTFKKIKHVEELNERLFNLNMILTDLMIHAKVFSSTMKQMPDTKDLNIASISLYLINCSALVLLINTTGAVLPKLEFDVESLIAVNNTIKVISEQAKELQKVMVPIDDFVLDNLPRVGEFVLKIMAVSAELLLANLMPKARFDTEKVHAVNNIIADISDSTRNIFKKLRVFEHVDKIKVGAIANYFVKYGELALIINGANKLMPSIKFDEKKIQHLNRTLNVINFNAMRLQNILTNFVDVSELHTKAITTFIFKCLDIQKAMLLAKIIPMFELDIRKVQNVTSNLMILGKSAKYVLNYMEIFDRVNQINTNNISKYIDTWIEINKELLKASLVSKIAQFNRADSPFKHSIDELTELVEFGKMLSENQVIYAEFDKIMNSIDRVSEAGNKFEEDKVELFKRQQTEIRKFVKTINSIDVEATDKLSRLLEGFAKLGLNVKDLNRLVEAITNDLARSLTQLSKEMNSVGKVISNETKRKDKRSKVIQTSVKNISDLVNRELTVIVKNEKSGSTGKNTSTGTPTVDETPSPEYKNQRVEGEERTDFEPPR